MRNTVVDLMARGYSRLTTTSPFDDRAAAAGNIRDPAAAGSGLARFWYLRAHDSSIRRIHSGVYSASIRDGEVSCSENIILIKS